MNNAKIFSNNAQQTDISFSIVSCDERQTLFYLFWKFFSKSPVIRLDATTIKDNYYYSRITMVS